MPQENKNLHIITEAASVFILVPILIWIALKQENILYRNILLIIAVLCILVDGYLLLKYKQWK